MKSHSLALVCLLAVTCCSTASYACDKCNAKGKGLLSLVGGRSSSSCDRAPDCGCEVQPECGCETVPTCGCETAPTCGCEMKRTFGFEKNPPSCGCSLFKKIFSRKSPRVVHQPAYSCDSSCDGGSSCGCKSIFNKIFTRKPRSVACDPVPTCGCEEVGCDSSCDSSNKKKCLLDKLFSKKSKSSCDAEPACGCEVAPNCECGASCGCETAPGCACQQSGSAYTPGNQHPPIQHDPVIEYSAPSVMPHAQLDPPAHESFRDSEMAPVPAPAPPTRMAPQPLPDNQVDPFLDDDASRVRRVPSAPAPRDAAPLHTVPGQPAMRNSVPGKTIQYSRPVTEQSFGESFDPQASNGVRVQFSDRLKPTRQVSTQNSTRKGANRYELEGRSRVIRASVSATKLRPVPHNSDPWRSGTSNSFQEVENPLRR